MFKFEKDRVYHCPVDVFRSDQDTGHYHVQLLCSHLTMTESTCMRCPEMTLEQLNRFPTVVGSLTCPPLNSSGPRMSFHPNDWVLSPLSWDLGDPNQQPDNSTVSATGLRHVCVLTTSLSLFSSPTSQVRQILSPQVDNLFTS